jgi:hypothetical protein
MVQIEYRVLRRVSWFCKEHTAEFSDLVNIKHVEEPIFLELFAGSGHVSSVAKEYGFKTITSDINPKLNPDICCDIIHSQILQYPQNPTIIWASVPCTTYSTLSLENHWNQVSIGYRQYYYTPKSQEAITALKILAKTIRIIKSLNPIFYFIENPRGALRHMAHMKFIPYRKTVSYADYGFDVYKPTDIFTNCQFFNPKQIETAVGKKFEGSIKHTVKDAYTRSLIPPALIHELFKSIPFICPKNPKKEGLKSLETTSTKQDISV